MDQRERAWLVTELLQLEGEARAKALDRACGNDIAMRAIIEELIAASAPPLPAAPGDGQPAEPTTITEWMMLRPQVTPRLDSGIGIWVGPYRVLEQLGEGGFGTVFLAEQREPIVRRVALKVIKPGMDTRGVIARFEAERQALAMMDHPNIARVFDAGATDEGRPYFVMELVRGDPITQYCDRRSMGIAQRLDLFMHVCQAVQHAHQKGIIHRDIKPSNVLVALVDGKPVPKVIDFGIAKATAVPLTDKTLFTELNQAIGTPE
jgi:serine/threonine protein kinase